MNLTTGFAQARSQMLMLVLERCVAWPAAVPLTRGGCALFSALHAEMPFALSLYLKLGSLPGRAG
jgi:hypothetical protein